MNNSFFLPAFSVVGMSFLGTTAFTDTLKPITLEATR